jgi:hypothetical protein
MTEAEHLRDQAARCLRLARASTDKTVNERLTELAADYLERAQALEEALPASQCQFLPRRLNRCNSNSTFAHLSARLNWGSDGLTAARPTH